MLMLLGTKFFSVRERRDNKKIKEVKEKPQSYNLGWKCEHEFQITIHFSPKL